MPIASRFEKALRRMAARCRPGSSARGRLAILLSSVVVIGIAGSVYSKLQYADARRTVEGELTTIADLKAAQIANWWQERRSDAKVVFKTPMIQARALEFLSGSAPAGQDLLVWMEMQRELYHYRQLILYDARRKPRLAATGKVGVVEAEDYRAVPVAAAVRGVPGTPWFMVAKADQEEAFGRYRRGAWTIGIVLLVSVLAAVLGVSLLWRRHDAQVLREQQVVDRLLNDELEQRVKDRTVQLEASNRELEAFCYSVSHDLRAPLRGIDGWSLALLEDYGDKLDEKGRQCLQRVRADTQRMGQLIDDLLLLSRVTRGPIQQGPVDLTALAQSVSARLHETAPERRVEFAVQPGLTAQGDARLLEIVLSNLLGNAWKFSGGRPLARVEFGRAEVDGKPAFCVRDNGVGFDMIYAQKLFGAFQRMHKASEFPGTGIGLAIVQRVIQRHGGRVWAEAQVDRGATFYFTLEETA